jgi:hypothetical protein
VSGPISLVGDRSNAKQIFWARMGCGIQNIRQLDENRAGDSVSWPRFPRRNAATQVSQGWSPAPCRKRRVYHRTDRNATWCWTKPLDRSPRSSFLRRIAATQKNAKTAVAGILCRRVAARKIWVDYFQGFRCAPPLAGMCRRVAARNLATLRITVVSRPHPDS